MSSKSKTKGSSFERKIATAFSEKFMHLYGVKNSFITNSGSGSRFGGKHSGRLDTTHGRHHLVGDITPPDDKFKFVIECKHYKDPVTFVSIVKGKVADWDKWINQVETDAKSTGKMPLLIIKYNLVPEVAIIRKSTAILLEHYDNAIYPILTYGNYLMYTLEDILSLSDKFFIEGEDKNAEKSQS